MAAHGGYRVTSFGVGGGRPLLRTRLRGGVVFYVAPLLVVGGACTAIPVGPAGPRRVWFHAGGLIAQALIAVALLLVPSSWLVDRIWQFNLLVALTNGVPWRLGSSASDGWTILDALTGSHRGSLLLSQRERIVRLAAQEQALGSPVGMLWAELCVAWVDVQLRAPSRADGFFTSDPPESAVDPWIDALYHAVRADWHRLHGRSLAALRTVRDTRDARLGELSPDADGLLALAEARALIQLDSHAVAERTLARVVGHTGPVARQAVVVRLMAAMELPTEEIEFATWRVLRHMRAGWLDPVETVHALWQAAERLREGGRIEAAQGARHAARTLAADLVARVPTNDQHVLRAALGAAADTPSAAWPIARP